MSKPGPPRPRVPRRGHRAWTLTWWSGRVRDPIFWAAVTQLVKTVLAAVVAWVLATRVFHLEQSFLAPWSALLVVNASVYRTLSQGGRQVGATVIGVLVATTVGQALGLDLVGVAVVMTVGLAIGLLGWFEGEQTTIAATALIVLTTGFSSDSAMLFARLFDTGIGIVVGIGINLLVWAPLPRRSAIAAMDAIDGAIGTLLVDVADGIVGDLDADRVEAWVQRTRGLDEDLDTAWALVRQVRESARLNPRRQARAWRDPADWHALLTLMEQAIAESRSLARTLGLGLEDQRSWDPAFTQRFAALLRRSGRAIEDADPAPLREARVALAELVRDLSGSPLDPRLWPEYGGVITNLRNVLVAMDAVALANPLGQPPLPLQGLHRGR